MAAAMICVAHDLPTGSTPTPPNDALEFDLHHMALRAVTRHGVAPPPCLPLSQACSRPESRHDAPAPEESPRIQVMMLRCTEVSLLSVCARSSVDRVLASEAKGRWFDPSRARQPQKVNDRPVGKDGAHGTSQQSRCSSPTWPNPAPCLAWPIRGWRNNGGRAGIAPKPLKNFFLFNDLA